MSEIIFSSCVCKRARQYLSVSGTVGLLDFSPDLSPCQPGCPARCCSVTRLTQTLNLKHFRREIKMSDNEEEAGPGPNNYQFTPSTIDKIFNCGQCDFSYKTIKQIMVHVRSSPNHEAVCVQCNGRYKSFDKLRAHLRKIHFQVGEVICNDCGKMSKTKDQHEQHYNQVHRVEKGGFQLAQICQ